MHEISNPVSGKKIYIFFINLSSAVLAQRVVKVKAISWYRAKTICFFFCFFFLTFIIRFLHVFSLFLVVSQLYRRVSYKRLAFICYFSQPR